MRQQPGPSVAKPVFSDRFRYCLKAAAGTRRSNLNAAQDSHVVNPHKLLLPIDLKKCPLEVFSFINEFAEARDHAASLELLHVAAPKFAGSKDERAFLAERDLLDRLAGRFVSSKISTSAHVLAGKPAEEIFVHARQSGVDLIILSCFTDCSVPLEKLCSPIVRELIRSAPCDISLLRVRTYFDCVRQWALVEDIVNALDYVGLFKPVDRWVPVTS